MDHSEYKIYIDDVIRRVENARLKVSKHHIVKIVAVSKYSTSQDIHKLYDIGQRAFGENKIQDLKAKAKELKNLPIEWHFIGHLQTNKVKYVIRAAEYIHSVDSVKLAEEINRKAEALDKVQKILIEVNTSGEESKYGIQDFDSLESLIEKCETLSNIEVKGLMTMAPFTSDEDVIRKCFINLREMKEKLNNRWDNITELSMGMTNDYKIAIEEGSTMLRIGTAIFGQRDISKSWREK